MKINGPMVIRFFRPLDIKGNRQAVLPGEYGFSISRRLLSGPTFTVEMTQVVHLIPCNSGTGLRSGEPLSFDLDDFVSAVEQGFGGAESRASRIMEQAPHEAPTQPTQKLFDRDASTRADDEGMHLVE